MADVRHMTMEELEAGLDEIRQSPKDEGVLKLLVRRPQTEEREILEEGAFDPAEGLVGDNWKMRGSSLTADGSSHPETQLTLTNVRAIALVAQAEDRWQLAGDQLYIDMDLSAENLPPGTQLALGSAVLEVTDQPHNGCKKYVERFGLDAMKWVNSPVGKELHLRGIYTKVVRAGVARVGDVVKKV